MVDIEQEITEANVRLPVALPNMEAPIDIQVRIMALAIAQRYIGDSCVKEGNLYQQLKMDQKLGPPVTTEDVVKAALIFERYIWGEWSKGIAEHAIESVNTEIADAIEKEFVARTKPSEE